MNWIYDGIPLGLTKSSYRDLYNKLKCIECELEMFSEQYLKSVHDLKLNRALIKLIKANESCLKNCERMK